MKVEEEARARTLEDDLESERKRKLLALLLEVSVRVVREGDVGVVGTRLGIEEDAEDLGEVGVLQPVDLAERGEKAVQVGVVKDVVLEELLRTCPRANAVGGAEELEVGVVVEGSVWKEKATREGNVAKIGDLAGKVLVRRIYLE